MTAYHMLVATIGTRILQRLPFERLQAKRIDMDVSGFSTKLTVVVIVVKDYPASQSALFRLTHPE